MVIPVVGNSLINRLASLYQNNKALSLELLGCNLPKTLMARTKEERFDIMANENLNAVGYFGGMAAFSKLLDVTLPKLKPVFQQSTAALGLAKTAFMVPLFAGALVATPFYRNAMTTLHTQTSDFKSLVKGQQQTDRQWLTHAVENKQKAQQFFAAGSVLGSLALGATLLARPQQLLGLAKQFEKAIMSAKPLQAFKNDAQAIVYWAAPVYAGNFLAARDKFEQKEQLLKFANFAALYAVPGMLVNKLFQPKLMQMALLPQTKTVLARLGNINALKEATSLAVSALLMAVSPQAINIALTKRRLAQAEQQPENAFQL